jgi:L-threonylcarbamoyladenylate synthase
METRIVPASQPDAIQQALDILQRGGLVAFPTDTVYGLGALAFNPQAIEELFVVKERQYNKAIAVLLSDPNELSEVAAQMNENARRLALRFWPGPLTLVVPRHPALPENLSPHATIGVRMPDHPVALRLMDLSGPLAVTSANLSGADNTETAQQVIDQLAGRIPLILDGGRTPGGSPSTVVDCTGIEPLILRSGPVSGEDIQAALNEE